jgi:hypothetical protein
MTRKTFEPGHEVSGSMLLGIIGSINETAIRPIREKHGLQHIEPDAWYSVQQVHDFFNDLEESPDSMFNLVSVGMELGKRIPFPPEIKTIEQAFGMFNKGNRATVRGGEGTHVETSFLDEHHIVVTVTNAIAPPDVMYGISYAVVKRFVPPGSEIVVEQEKTGDTIRYDIRW